MVHMTRAQILRLEFLSRQNAATPSSASTTAGNVSDESADDQPTIPDMGSPTSHRRLKVRMNRAQRLRVSDHDAKSQANSTSPKPPSHLDNVEARVDFGQDGWHEGSAKAAEAAEREREALLNASEVDVGEFEADGADSGRLRGRKGSVLDVVTGVSFRSGWEDSNTTNRPACARIYMSCAEGSWSYERKEIHERILPSMRSFASTLGVELLWRDMQWGVPWSMVDAHCLQSLLGIEQRRCAEYPGRVSTVCFVGPSANQKGIVPLAISVPSMDYFNEFLDSNETPGRDVLRKWYRLDANLAPPAYVLQSISLGLLGHSKQDVRHTADAWEAWSSEKSNLVKNLARACKRLLEDEDADPMPEEDVESLQNVDAVPQQYEALTALARPEGATLAIFFYDVGNVTRQLSSAGEDEDLESLKQGFREKLQPEYLLELAAPAQVFDETTKHTGSNRLYDFLSNHLRDTLQKTRESTLPSDILYSEMANHIKSCQLKSRRFVGKARLINKVIGYFETKSRQGVPPLLITGTTGSGKASLLCRAVERLVSSTLSVSTGRSSMPLTIFRDVGLTSSSRTPIGLLRSICTQFRRAIYAMEDVTMDADAVLRRFGPTFAADYTPNDLPSLTTLFSSYLTFVAQKRPVHVILLHADKLCSDVESSPLSWLPLENNDPNVRVAITLSSSSVGLLERLRARSLAITSALVTAGCDFLGATLIELDSIDIQTCHMALTRWLKQDRRNLTLSQRRSVVATATQPTPESPVHGCATPFRLWLHYLRSRLWHSWEEPAPMSSSTEATLLDGIFDVIEVAVGRALTSRFSRVLSAMRDGAMESELEDLLSIDEGVMADVVLWQIESVGAQGTCPIIVPRVPHAVIARLLQLFESTFGLVERVCTEAGIVLIVWTNPLVRETSIRRYGTVDHRVPQNVYSDIAGYFKNEFSAVTGPTVDSLGKPVVPVFAIKCKLKEQDENFHVDLKPHALLPVHSLHLVSLDEQSFSFNTRLFKELFPALVLSQRWHDLQDLATNFAYFEGFLRVNGVDESLKLFHWMAKEGKRPGNSMPTECQLLIKHLTLFLRQRSQVFTFFDATTSVHPPGLWLQELHNFPSMSSAKFAEALMSNLEENWDDYLGPRGGRLEFDPNWKPDWDSYVATPIRHTLVQCCAVSADGKLLATGAEDGGVRIWSIQSGEELDCFTHLSTNARDKSNNDESDEAGTILPLKAGVTCVSFSGEKPPFYVVSCSHDPHSEPMIKLFPLRQAVAEKTLAGAHSRGALIVKCEFLSPENRRIVSIGTDFNVVLWEAARCRIIRIVPFQHLEVSTERPISGAKKGGSQGKQMSIEDKRRRRFPSGWPQVAGAVSSTGLFAFGSAQIAVMDGRWRELLLRDLNCITDKEVVSWHRLSAATFNSDSTVIYASSGVPPDDQQMMAVEKQQTIERMNAKQSSRAESVNAGDGDFPEPPSNAHSPFMAANMAATDAEGEIRKARLSIIRAWNLHSGHQLLFFSISDSVTSLNVSPNDSFLLGTCRSGAITGWNSQTAQQEFCRFGHANTVLQLSVIPPGSRRGKRGTIAETDDSGVFGYSSPTTTLSTSRSLASLSSAVSLPVQFATVGTDGLAQLWSIPADQPDPGHSPVTVGKFSRSGEFFLTIGGSLCTHHSRPNALIRLWESVNGTNRCKFELPETFRTEAIGAAFFPGDESKAFIGCRNGAVRIYRVRTGEVIKEFWADVELALGEATLRRKVEWPFAATGTSVLTYALHPDGNVLAVAVAGNERTAEPSSTSVQSSLRKSVNAEAELLRGLESAGLRDLAEYARKSATTPHAHHDPAERSGDMVLRDRVQLTFWDIDGNPLCSDGSFFFPILFNISDVSCPSVPSSHLPSLNRANSFVLKWSPDGKSLFASDDCDVIKECSIDIRDKTVTGIVESRSIAKIIGPMVWKQGSASWNCRALPPNIAQGSANMPSFKTTISSATAFSVMTIKNCEYLCFAYGPAVIGLRVRNLASRVMGEVHWYLGHSALGSAAGNVIGCEFVPNVPGKGEKVGHAKIGVTGVIVSASENGTVLVQDVVSKEICAVFHAGSPVRFMSLSPLAAKASSHNRLRIALGKADGTVVFLRYFP
ncbi:hypothetical protein DFJ73DRAFT_875715 [Zopfochytrium polystomum]|nr:hypothetical protein DFJ73DRAFT_875715 [Zopfochytrium polystomum]